jgi:hypothetical protein
VLIPSKCLCLEANAPHIMLQTTPSPLASKGICLLKIFAFVFEEPWPSKCPCHRRTFAFEGTLHSPSKQCFHLQGFFPASRKYWSLQGNGKEKYKN